MPDRRRCCRHCPGQRNGSITLSPLHIPAEQLGDEADRNLYAAAVQEDGSTDLLTLSVQLHIGLSGPEHCGIPAVLDSEGFLGVVPGDVDANGFAEVTDRDEDAALFHDRCDIHPGGLAVNGYSIRMASLLCSFFNSITPSFKVEPLIKSGYTQWNVGNLELDHFLVNEI